MPGATYDEGHVYTMTYDALSRPLAATNALGRQVFLKSYDLAGNLTNRLDGAGNSIQYTYDTLNRLVHRQYGHGMPWPYESTLTHDAVGNLLTASNETASLSFAYDAMDRLASAATTVSNFTYTAAYARDAGGLVTNLTYAPGKSVTRAYDADGRLVGVSDWLGHTWTFVWDGTGKPTGSTSPGGITATNHYDAAGRLSSWSVGSLAGRAIARDLAGLKTREDVTAGPHPFPAFVRYSENAFDAADRLVTAQVRYGSHTNAAVTETYHYDGNGALTNLVAGSKVMSTGTAGILARTVYSFACTPPSTRERRFLSSQTIAAPPTRRPRCGRSPPRCWPGEYPPTTPLSPGCRASLD
jgi:YD repeat-containing protein